MKKDVLSHCSCPINIKYYTEPQKHCYTKGILFSAILFRLTNINALDEGDKLHVFMRSRQLLLYLFLTMI